MKNIVKIQQIFLGFLLIGITHTIHSQGYGNATGHNRDTYVINSDRSNHRSEFRMQTANKSYTFSHMNDRMGLFYQSSYTGWQNRGSEIFTIGHSGNTRMNNVFVGDVGFGTSWAGFAHNNRRNKNDYSLLAHKDGSYTLINKKNTGTGYIGFRIGNGVDKMVVHNNGNIGMGTLEPNEKLDIKGNIRINDNKIYFRGGTDKNHGIGRNAFSNVSTIDGPVLFGYMGGALGSTDRGNKIALRWSSTGNVGIGIDNPTEKLEVTGTIKINDGDVTLDDGNIVIGQSQLSSSTDATNTMLTVTGGVKTDKVVLNIGSFPDYVFANDYALMPIQEVAEYVAANKHLPNIPSEKEIIATGLDVTAISVKLVEKVEELTLYTIQQEEKLTAQDQLIQALMKRLERLENKDTNN